MPLPDTYGLTKCFAQVPVATCTQNIPRAKISARPFGRSYRKKRAKFLCEIPGCKTPKFDSIHKEVYCEVHHVIPLSEGGRDSIQNAIFLCPVHHREAHFGTDRSTLRESMQKIRLRT
nr:HNH endonuclease signature motif containing protein [uncultured Albidiferax sp.]